MIRIVDLEKRPVWFWLVTHGLAIAAGWAIVSTSGRRSETAAAATHLPEPARKMKVSRQRQQLDRTSPSARLVLNLLEEMDAAGEREPVAPAKDRAAAGRAAIDAWIMDQSDPALREEARVRFGHWLEADHEAALLYWDGSGSAGNLAMMGLYDVARMRLETVSLGDLAQWIRASKAPARGIANTVILDVFTESAARSRDQGLLVEILGELPPDASGRLLAQALRAWPEDQLGSLEDLVRVYPDRTALQTFLSRLKPEDVIKWVRTEMRNEGSLAPMLKESSVTGGVISGAAGTSVQDRLALMSEIFGNDPNSSYANVKPANLVRQDLARWLDQSDLETEGGMSDWRHRLRLGEISSRQVMDEAIRDMPKVAAEQSEEFRKFLFEQLVSIHPVSSMELISDQPLRQRERSMVEAAMTLAGRADPQNLVELLSQIPPSLASKPNDRFQVWVRAAAPAYDKHGESYVSWVSAMPPGIERDWALAGLVAHFKAGDPGKSEYLASLKTMPSGWRPAK